MPAGRALRFSSVAPCGGSGRPTEIRPVIFSLHPTGLSSAFPLALALFGLASPSGLELAVRDLPALAKEVARCD